MTRVSLPHDLLLPGCLVSPFSLDVISSSPVSFICPSLFSEKHWWKTLGWNRRQESCGLCLCLCLFCTLFWFHSVCLLVIQILVILENEMRMRSRDSFFTRTENKIPWWRKESLVLYCFLLDYCSQFPFIKCLIKREGRRSTKGIPSWTSSSFQSLIIWYLHFSHQSLFWKKTAVDFVGTDTPLLVRLESFWDILLLFLSDYSSATREWKIWLFFSCRHKKKSDNASIDKEWMGEKRKPLEGNSCWREWMIREEMKETDERRERYCEDTVRKLTDHFPVSFGIFLFLTPSHVSSHSTFFLLHPNHPSPSLTLLSQERGMKKTEEKQEETLTDCCSCLVSSLLFLRRHRKKFPWRRSSRNWFHHEFPFETEPLEDFCVAQKKRTRMSPEWAWKWDVMWEALGFPGTLHGHLHLPAFRRPVLLNRGKIIMRRNLSVFGRHFHLLPKWFLSWFSGETDRCSLPKMF